jgi:hypothetical protein
LGFDPKKIKNFSSSLFEVIGKIDNHELRCNSDGFGWEFSDDLVREQMPKLNGADFMIAIVNVPLEDNWYSRRLGNNQVVFTFYEIKEILQSANIPLENVIYRLLNAYTFAYKRNENKIPEFHEMTDFTHDETRGCIFDMNGIKSDLVASCHNPIIGYSGDSLLNLNKKHATVKPYMFRVHGDSAAVNRPSLKTVMRLPAQNSHG